MLTYTPYPSKVTPGKSRPLGNTTRNVSPPQDLKDLRRRRYNLQEEAARILPSSIFRVHTCLKRAYGEPTINKSNEHGHAYWDGVMVCGSLWVCPVCASRITEKRRQELEAAVKTSKYSLVMVTLTLQHEHHDRLQTLLEALLDAFRRLKMGKAWMTLQRRYKIACHVRSLEFTWNPVHGWHCHIHWLLFSEHPEGDIDTEALQIDLTAKYSRLLVKHGRYISEVYGIDVRKGNKAAGDYVAKFGLEAELTKTVTKQGKNGSLAPFQILEKAAAGDGQSKMLFLEYAVVTKGKKQLHWSHGARNLLGLNEDEPTDEELAHSEAKPDDIIMMTFTRPQFYQVVKKGLRLELLEAAEESLEALLSLLDRHLIIDRLHYLINADRQAIERNDLEEY